MLLCRLACSTKGMGQAFHGNEAIEKAPVSFEKPQYY